MQLPSQRELNLQRRVEATERQMAELRQELKALQNNPATHLQTAEGGQINLQVLYFASCLCPCCDRPFYRTTSIFRKSSESNVCIAATGAGAVWQTGRAE